MSLPGLGHCISSEIIQEISDDKEFLSGFEAGAVQTLGFLAKTQSDPKVLVESILTILVYDLLRKNHRPDMLVHHMASIACCCISLQQDECEIGKDLIQTELTTPIPVMWHKRNRHPLLKAIFPVTFIWRTYKSVMVTKRVLTDFKNIPGTLASGTVSLCNFYWLFKVFRGLKKEIDKKRKKGLEGVKDQPPTGNQKDLDKNNN